MPTEVFPTLVELCIRTCAAHQLTSLAGLPEEFATRIGLAYARARGAELDEQDARVLTSHADVKALSLARSTRLDEAQVARAARRLRSCRHLSVCGVQSLGDAGVERVARAAGRHLRSLNLSELDLSDRAVQAVAAACPLLEALRLNRCFKLTDAGLSDLSSRCPRLALLHMRGCAKVQDAGLADLLRGCTRLRDLDLSKCPLVTWEGLRGAAPRIRPRQRVVADDWTQHLGDDEDSPLVEVSGCPSLQRLALAGCVRVEDRLVRLLSGLSALDLSDCHRVTAASLEQAARACPSLRSLRPRGIPSLSDAALATIARHCPALVELDLSWCSALTDAAFVPLSTLTQLETLSMSYCVLVGAGACPPPASAPNKGPRARPPSAPPSASASGPALLGLFCRSLSRIAFAACPLFGDEALRSLLADLPALREVNAFGSGVCTPPARLREAHPSVRFAGAGWQLEDEARDAEEAARAEEAPWMTAGGAGC